MTGIQFVTNEKGKKVAVQIDLKKFSEIWSDFYDNLLMKKRAKEPRKSFESVRQLLQKKHKLYA